MSKTCPPDNRYLLQGWLASPHQSGVYHLDTLLQEHRLAAPKAAAARAAGAGPSAVAAGSEAAGDDPPPHTPLRALRGRLAAGARLAGSLQARLAGRVGAEAIALEAKVGVWCAVLRIVLRCTVGTGVFDE
jgi:hypothetical protein